MFRLETRRDAAQLLKTADQQGCANEQGHSQSHLHTDQGELHPVTSGHTGAGSAG